MSLWVYWRRSTLGVEMELKSSLWSGLERTYKSLQCLDGYLKQWGLIQNSSEESIDCRNQPEAFQ